MDGGDKQFSCKFGESVDTDHHNQQALREQYNHEEPYPGKYTCMQCYFLF